MVTKTVERTYHLDPAEVKLAFWKYLKGDLDQPVPEHPTGMTLRWRDPGEVFVSFPETVTIGTQEKNR